jgi:two-component system, chemotaxis family, CheB/CheR fusion protein
LFLGPSEGVTRLARLFASLDKKHRIYRRLEAEVARYPNFPKPRCQRMIIRRGRGRFRTERIGSTLARAARWKNIPLSIW